MPSTYINEFPEWTPHDSNRRDNGLLAARLMANAALTAPKGGGVDSCQCEVVWGEEDLDRIAGEMENSLVFHYEPRLLRNRVLTEAAMVRESDCVLFVGSYRSGDSPLDAGCGFCAGRMNCSYFYESHVFKSGQPDFLDLDEERRQRRERSLIYGPLCSLRVVDHGIAVGSAMKLSTTLFVDAMPFFSVGVAGMRLGYCRRSQMVVGICVASKQKNPYVDVLPDYHLNNMAKVTDNLRKNYVISRIVYWYDYRSWYPRSAEESEGGGE